RELLDAHVFQIGDVQPFAGPPRLAGLRRLGCGFRRRGVGRWGSIRGPRRSMALVIGWHETLLRDWKYRGEMRSDSSIGPDGGGVNACVRRQEISLRRDAQPWHRPPAVVARTPGSHAQLANSFALASTIGRFQRRSVTAVPWTLIPAPRITQHEVDAEPSLRAASGSLKSACSHVGWRPAPRLRLAIADRRRNHHQRKRIGHRQNSDHKSKDADHPREPDHRLSYEGREVRMEGLRRPN